MSILYYEINNCFEALYKPQTNNKENLRIFGKYFFNNNKDKCKIIYRNKEYELKEFFDEIDKDYNNKDLIRFKLIGINDINDMSYMFHESISLISISFISNETSTQYNSNSNLNNDSYKNSYSTENKTESELYQTNSISSIENINNSGSISTINNSIQNYYSQIFGQSNKILNMSYMFSGCKSLISLPDISKWNTTYTTKMSNLFSQCNSLLSLPDISKWDTSNVKDMSHMFRGCINLITIPDISKWNTSNVINLNHLFYECINLISIPDISK